MVRPLLIGLFFLLPTYSHSQSECKALFREDPSLADAYLRGFRTPYSTVHRLTIGPYNVPDDLQPRKPTDIVGTDDATGIALDESQRGSGPKLHHELHPAKGYTDAQEEQYWAGSNSASRGGDLTGESTGASGVRGPQSPAYTDGTDLNDVDVDDYFPNPERVKDHSDLIRKLQSLVETLRRNKVNVDELSWVNLLNELILPGMSRPRPTSPNTGYSSNTSVMPDRWLAVAVVGTPNAGKSALVRSLEANVNGDPSQPPNDVVASGVTPHLTRRFVVMAPRDLDVSERFGSMLALTSPDQSTREGPPLLVRSELQPNVVVIDTPGIDYIFDEHQKDAHLKVPGVSILKKSEVILFIFTLSDLGNDNLHEQLRQATAYWGRRKVILAFKVNPSIDAITAEQELTRMGRIFDPDFTMNRVGSELTPIIGTYILPERTEVFRGEQSSFLVPAGNSVEFSALINALNRSADAIWQDLFGEMMRKIVIEAQESVRGLVVEGLRVELMRLALKIISIEAAKMAAVPFNYDPVREQIHWYWRNLGPDLVKKMRNIGDWARPEKRFFRGAGGGAQGIRTPMNNLSQAGVDGIDPSTRLKLEAAVKHITGVMSSRTIFVQLGDRNPDGSKLQTTDPQLFEIKTKILNIVQQLTVLRHSGLINPSGVLQLTLGKYGSVDTALAEAVDEVAQMDVQKCVTDLNNSLGQFQPSLNDIRARQLVEYLNEFRRKRGFISNTFEGVLATAHVVVPLFVAGAEAYIHFQAYPSIANIINPLAYLAYIVPTNVSARVVYGTDRKYLDALLRPVVDAWSKAQQEIAFEEYVRTYILRRIGVYLDDSVSKLVMGPEQGMDILEDFDRYLASMNPEQAQGLRLIADEHRGSMFPPINAGSDGPLSFRLFPIDINK